MARRNILRCMWCPDDGQLIEVVSHPRPVGCLGLSDSDWGAVDHVIDQHPGEWLSFGIDAIDEVRVAA